MTLFADAKFKNLSGNQSFNDMLKIYNSFNDSFNKPIAVRKKSTPVRKPVEIDLHKEARGYSPKEKFQNQLQAVREHLDRYRGKHGSKFIFINGYGIEDTLRKAIMKILRQESEYFSVEDANPIYYRYHTALAVVVK